MDNSQFTPPVPPAQPSSQTPPYTPPSSDSYFEPQGMNGNPPPPPPPAPQPAQKATDGLGIASMVLGIVSVVFACCYGGGILLAIPGLILGLAAKKRPDTGKRSGFALAGIIISAISIGLNLILIFIMVSAIIEIIHAGGSVNWSDYENLFEQYANQFGNL